MSYRAFKRLLGETSLERKCRFLFGIGILLLISLSFWLYAVQTEHLAYDQALNSCRLLVHPILAQHHLLYLQGKEEKKQDGRQLFDAIFQAGRHFTDEQHYQYSILQENQINLDSYERDKIKEFQAGKADRMEDNR